MNCPACDTKLGVLDNVCPTCGRPVKAEGGRSSDMSASDVRIGLIVLACIVGLAIFFFVNVGPNATSGTYAANCVMFGIAVIVLVIFMAALRVLLGGSRR